MATKTNSTKKNTRGSTLKSPVKSTGKPSQPKKGVTQSKNTIKKNRKPQRRELWVVGTFLAAFLLFLSVFGVEGMLLELLKSFIRGLIGSGSYILPFAFIIACVIIIFARGNPVAKKLTALFSVPVLFGMLDHFIMRDVEISEKYVQKLYMTGTVLESGGVISGGIAMLMSALLSEIGAMIITILVLVYTFLVIFNIKLSQIIDFIISIKDGYDERRIERGEYEYIEYDEYEEDEEPVYMSHWTKKPVPVPAQPKNENKYRPVTDIPLDPVSPVRKDKIKKQEEAEEGDFHEAAPKAKKKAPFNRNTETSYDGLVHIPRKKESYDGLVNNPRDNVPLPRFVPPSSDEEIEMWREQEEEKDALLFNVDVETEENTVSIPEENITVGPAKPVAENVVVVDTHKANSENSQEIEKVQSAQADYIFPPITLLKEDKGGHSDDATEELRQRSQILNDTLVSFGVEAQIINVIRGPAVTRYELILARGVKLTRLTTLQNDIALALGATSVRIAAIPDKSAVGIEVPNKIVQTVFLRDVLTSKAMTDMKSKIAFALGKDITGSNIVGDIAKMPHMLIAGTTGSGKSVCINSIIVSILYRATPKEVRFIMIDPKMVELGNYNGIPHLLVPVVTDYRKASGALNWAVVEMERRYKLMSECNVRDIASYNNVMQRNRENPIPRIVIIIDELADLMMAAAKEVEESICRIAQKARAAGMHLIIATQRPSADVLTGLMKSNIPSRIAFAVASQIESRIILDTGGADKLIGRGDMLYAPIGQGKPQRIQGCYLSDGEVKAITDAIKQNSQADYSTEIIDHIEHRASADDESSGINSDEECDELLNDAIDVVLQTGQASSSVLQRKLKIGYARAARIIDQIEDRGIIGPLDSSKNRQILISKQDWQEMKARRENY